MIGSRLGSKSNFVNSAIGSISDDESGSVAAPSWTIDSTSLKSLPANSTEWSNFIAAKGLVGVAIPNSLWNCQEATGSLVDSIGSLSLAAVGAPSYRQAVAGYTRLGVQFTDGATVGFSAAGGAGPNPSITSSCWLWITKITTSSVGTRGIMTIGGAAGTTDHRMQSLVTTGVMRDVCANVIVADGGANNMASGGVMPTVLTYDRTGARAVAYSGQAKIIGTYSAGVTDGNKGLGNCQTNATPAMQTVYGAMWSGAVAEMSDATMKALLTAMGFAIPWS